MKTKTLLLSLLFITSLNVFSQEKQQTPPKSKIGIGFGYHNSSIAGDSIRPLEVSLRYRLNKHTFLLYAPLHYGKDYLNKNEKPDYVKQEHYDMFNHSFRKSLWGVGIGYDYTLFSYSTLDFFAGISIDYQAYKYREDFHYMHYELIEGVIGRPVEYEDFYKIEKIDYYWDRVRGMSIIPNTGLRFTTSKFSVETKLGLYCSNTHQKATSYYKSKPIWYDDNSWSTWHSSYPDKYRNGVSVRPDISVQFHYYF
jgi:hypothetical protein